MRLAIVNVQIYVDKDYYSNKPSIYFAVMALLNHTMQPKIDIADAAFLWNITECFSRYCHTKNRHVLLRRWRLSSWLLVVANIRSPTHNATDSRLSPKLVTTL